VTAGDDKGDIGEVPAVDADRDDAETALRQLLAEHPEATVFAVQRDDFGPPDPDHPGLAGLPCDGASILGPVEALDLLHPTSRPVALTALDRITGHQVLRDELFAVDGSPIDSYFFDTSARRKLFIGLQIPVSGRQPVTNGASSSGDVPRRVVRLRTDGLGRVVSAEPAAGGRVVAVGELSIESVHPDDLDGVRSVWASMLANPGVAHRCRYRAKGLEGWTWQEASITSHLDEPGDGTVHLEVIDITTEMQAHEEVRRRERTLHRLAEALPQAVVQLDREGTAVYANGRADALLGPDLDHLHSLIEATDEADRELVAAALSEALSGADHDLEVHLARPPAGESMVVEVTLRGLATDQGEPDGVMCCISDVTERARMRANLEQRATFDQLTGCHNRGSTLRSLAMALHPNSGAGVAVIFVDLDRFKEVNDRLGHQAGDEVLRAVASLLGSAVRGNDVVGRMGGDEFVVICPEVGDVDAAMATASRIAEALDPDRVPDLLGVRASIGVAWSDTAIGPAELLARADAAMYESKREGTGRVVVADE
jgi:diguanylate cyclase (GGDEF)-like protein/PAS domain S-box-containing protein